MIDDVDVQMINFLENLECDEAWCYTLTLTERIWTAPKGKYALPFGQDEKDILAEENISRFVVDLLVGEHQAKRVDDEWIGLVPARHNADAFFDPVQSVLAHEFAAWHVVGGFDLVVFCLFLRTQTCNKELFVYLIANLCRM